MNSKKENFPYKLIISVGAIILIFYVLYPIIINEFFENWNERGVFGDSFGALTSFFGGITICLLIITLIYQKKEYRKTLDEFELSRKAQQQSKEALEKQAEILNIQKFENTFFKLFEIHLEVTQGLLYGAKTKGKATFSLLADVIKNHMKEPPMHTFEHIQDQYMAFHTYTSSLSNIFNYIDAYYPTDNITNQRLYFEFLFGQFTSAEWAVFNFYVERIEKDIEEKYILKYDLDRLNPTEYKRPGFSL